MFKSVFAKYLTTFMVLLLAGFLMLLLIFHSVIGNVSEETKTRVVTGAAQAAVSELSGMFGESGMADFATYIGADGTTVRRVLRAVTTNSDNITVSVTDADGRMLLAVGEHVYDSYTVTDGQTGDEVTTTIPDDGALFRPVVLDADCLTAIAGAGENLSSGEEELPTKLPVYTEGKLRYGCAVRDADGRMVGTVIVVAESDMWGDLDNHTLQSAVVASMWILLAALIATYYVTERTVGPLRQMSRAAKLMSTGKFDTRIEVRGKDEVAELAVAFNQMSEALGNLESMRNSFIANISHDLRTPMTTIAGFIDGILDGVIPPEEEKHYLTVVAGEVRRLSRLVTQLLDLSRLQAGDRKFDMKPFDVCEMGRQILISFEQKIDAKRLDVSFDCDEDHIYVLADRDAIHQILYNICDNAVKFASEGGKLNMTFTCPEPEGHKARKAVISVFNEGQGIPPEDLPFIFDRFYKSDKSRSLDKTGVGLGMFITKTIIEAHGETIRVDSEYGKNCTFTFTLPLTEPPVRSTDEGFVIN